MKYSNYIYSGIMAVVCILLLYFSPDPASMIFIGVMIMMLAFGFMFGIMRVHKFTSGFHFGLTKIGNIQNVSADDNWDYIRGLDTLFNSALLDRIFNGYFRAVEETRDAELSYTADIQDYINDDVLELKCFKNLIDGIPGMLTGIGILGTFYGLIQGLGGIRFSSVDVVVESISTLTTGIDTAFYTSVAGVLLSILFEIMIKMEWNGMLEMMDNFIERFHWQVIPSTKMQRQRRELQFFKEMTARAPEVK